MKKGKKSGKKKGCQVPQKTKNYERTGFEVQQKTEKQKNKKVQWKGQQVQHLEKIITSFSIKQREKELTDEALRSNFDAFNECPSIKDQFQKSITNPNNFVVFLHSVTRSQNAEVQTWLISRIQLPNFDSIELFIRQNPTDYTSKINGQLHSLEFVSTLEITKEELNIIFSFNQNIIGQLLDSKGQYSFRSFSEFLSKKAKTDKFLLTLMQQQSTQDSSNSLSNQKTNYQRKIDFQQMNKYNEQRQETQISLDSKQNLSYLLKEFVNREKISQGELYISQNVIPQIQVQNKQGKECLFNRDNSFLETDILPHLPPNSNFLFELQQYGVKHIQMQTSSTVIAIFYPKETTILQFIKIYANLCDISQDECLELFRKVPDSLLKQTQNQQHKIQELKLEDTLFEAIYGAERQSQHQLFSILRKQFKKSQNKLTSQNYLFNRSNPLLLCRAFPHFNSFDFLHDQRINMNKQVLQSIASSTIFNLSLLPLEYYEINYIPIIKLENLLSGFSICSLIKDFMITRELITFLSIEQNVKIDLFIESCSLSSYSKRNNLELLEVLGDVVIKYISSLYLSKYLENQSEHLLSQLRSQYINNVFLGIAAFRSGFHFFIKHKKPVVADSWVPNFVQFINPESESNKQPAKNQIQEKQVILNHSNLSDMLESIFGAVYASNQFDIQECLNLAKRLGIMIDKNLLRNFPTFVSGSFLISEQELFLNSGNNISLNMTYSQLYELTEKKQKSIGKLILNEELMEDERLLFELNNDFVQLKRFVKMKLRYTKYKDLITSCQNESEANSFSYQSQFAWFLIKPFFEKEIQLSDCMNSLSSECNGITQMSQEQIRQKRLAQILHERYKFIHYQVLYSSIGLFEDNCIQYKFNNKQILIKALNVQENKQVEFYNQNYQMLELFGDAVIEMLIVSNGYHILRNKFNIIETPLTFSRMKQCLLSNDFLSRLAVLNKFHNFALNFSNQQRQEIELFLKECQLSSEFRMPVSHITTSPKILGDLIESVAAAVLEDSNIATFVKVIGKLFSPFLSFFIKFYQQMVFNEKEAVIVAVQQSKEKLQIKNTRKLVFGNNTKIHEYETKVYIQNILLGSGQHENELIAEKKAFHQVYENYIINRVKEKK